MVPSMEELLNAPALEPPPGVTPVFSVRGDQPWFTAVAVLVVLVPGLLFLLRVYTKLRTVRRIDIIEYITLVAFGLFITVVVLAKVALDHGAGQHQWNLKRREFNDVLYWFNLLEIIYCPAIFMVKLAILLQYLFILAPTHTVNPVLSIGSKILIVANAIFYIVSLCISSAACNPRERIWNDLIPGKCLNHNLMIMITSLWNILSDVAILLLPAHTVWKLQIPLRKKLQLIGLFAIGLLACITNAFIIMYLLRTEGPKGDISYNILFVGLWAGVEISLGLIVVCALTLPKVLESHWKTLISTLSKPFSAASSSISSMFTSSSTHKGRSDSSEGGSFSHDGIYMETNMTTVHTWAPTTKPVFGSETGLVTHSAGDVYTSCGRA